MSNGAPHDEDDDVLDVDFSSGVRGPALPSSGKTRITIRIDNEILDWFREQAEAAGGGSYQYRINAALREHIAAQREPLEATLRRVLREEMATYRVDRPAPEDAGRDASVPGH
jgi:uncharacterized protein (DUF4415 family)